MKALTNSSDLLGFANATEFTNSLSENTKRAYIRDICNFFKVHELSDITLQDIQSVNTSSSAMYIARLKSEGKEISTINRHMTSLSKFYRYLSRREKGIMDYNPFDTKEGSVRIKQNKSYSNTRCLTTDEIQKMVKATDMEKNEKIRTRNKILFLLLATTGLRRNEIVNIKLGQITTTHGQSVLEFEAKGNQDRFVVLSSTIKNLINSYLDLRDVTLSSRNEYLLVNHTSNTNYYKKDCISAQTVYNVIKELAEIANIEDASSISPHSLRHSFATECFEMGMKGEDIQDLMGHADVATTRRYDHTNNLIKNSPSQMLENLFLNK